MSDAFWSARMPKCPRGINPTFLSPPMLQAQSIRKVKLWQTCHEIAQKSFKIVPLGAPLNFLMHQQVPNLAFPAHSPKAMLVSVVVSVGLAFRFAGVGAAARTGPHKSRIETGCFRGCLTVSGSSISSTIDAFSLAGVTDFQRRGRYSFYLSNRCQCRRNCYLLWNRKTSKKFRHSEKAPGTDSCRDH
jgi:hypothetical protein